MTLMDKRKGERGEERDRDGVKDSIREFIGEEEGGAYLWPLIGDRDSRFSPWPNSVARSGLLGL